MPDKCQYIHAYGARTGEQCSRYTISNTTFCKTHEGYQRGVCKAQIEQGKTKGTPCFRPATCGEFCGKHNPEKAPRRKQTMQETQACPIPICEATVYATNKKCTKKATQGSRFCGKHHELHTMRDFAAAISKRLCGDGLRCKNFVDDPEKLHCDECLARNREVDNARHNEHVADPTRCLECGKSSPGFAHANTRRCTDCYARMRAVEDKRSRRVAQRAINNPESYYKSYKHDAKRRNYNFNLLLAEFTAIIAQPCTYCGMFVETEFNGIDRINSCEDYTPQNCVAACKLCNYFKSAHTTTEFINHCLAICKFQQTGEVSESRIQWISPNDTSFRIYGAAARRRQLVFEITEAEYNALKRGACYLCGSPATQTVLNGIDRICSSKGYTSDNVCSCCPPCNHLKLDHSLEDVIAHCEKIRTHHSNACAVSPPTRVMHL